jgi:hypothetical protein
MKVTTTSAPAITSYDALGEDGYRYQAQTMGAKMVFHVTSPTGGIITISDLRDDGLLRLLSPEAGRQLGQFVDAVTALVEQEREGCRG